MDSPDRAVAVFEQQLASFPLEFLNDVAGKGTEAAPTRVTGTVTSITVLPRQWPLDVRGDRLFREVRAAPSSGLVHDSSLDARRQ